MSYLQCSLCLHLLHPLVRETIQYLRSNWIEWSKGTYVMSRGGLRIIAQVWCSSMFRKCNFSPKCRCNSSAWDTWDESWIMFLMEKLNVIPSGPTWYLHTWRYAMWNKRWFFLGGCNSWHMGCERLFLPSFWKFLNLQDCSQQGGLGGEGIWACTSTVVLGNSFSFLRVCITYDWLSLNNF